MFKLLHLKVHLVISAVKLEEVKILCSDVHI